MCPPPPPAPAPTPPPASRVEPVGLGATKRDRWAPGCAENRPNPVRGMGLDGVCVSVSVCVCVCCAAPRVFPRSWDHPRAGVGAARRLSLACLSPVRSRVDLSCSGLPAPFDVSPAQEYIGRILALCAVSNLRQQRQRRSVGRWWWRRRLFGLAGWPAVWPRRVATHHRRLGLVPASWLGFPTLRWRRSSAADRDVRIFDGWHVVRPPSCLWLCAPIQCDLGDYEFFQDHVVLEARWQALVSW